MPDNNAGKKSPGSRFTPPPATIWNNMIDAGRAWADSQLSSPGGPPLRPRETDIIKIRNDSGALRRKGEILKIDGKALDEVNAEHIWLLGVVPTTDCYFGILREPAGTSVVAPLQVSGCCMALVDIVDVDHTRADVVDGEYVLTSSDSGPIEILYAPESTGEQTCVVRWGGGGRVDLIHGIVIASLTRGYYTIRLSDWSAEALPDTGTEDSLCEILAEQVDIVDETYSDCDVTQALPEFEETEDGSTPHIVRRQTTAQDPVVDVKAFHRASIFVPLELWSEVLIADLGDMIGETKIYQIADGFQQHLIAYDKQYECCELTGEWKLVSRKPYIFAAVSCGEDACEPCPTE